MKKKLITLLLIISGGIIHGQTWLHDMDQAKALAKAQQRFILVDFYADWCGPCKEMDANTWSKPEVVRQLDKLVIAKIDIDFNKALAARFGVKAIPHVFIVDPLGNCVHDIEGYQSAYSMAQLLQNFPEDVKPVVAALQKLEANPEDPMLMLGVAAAYQNCTKPLDAKGRGIFLRAGDSYLKQAKRSFKKAEKEAGLERVELLDCCGRLLQDKAKKVIKTLEKMGAENVHPENKALACYIASMGYLELEDAENAKIFAAKLQQQEDGDNYINELQATYPEFEW